MRWGGFFDIDNKIIRLQEEELKTQAPDFWSNPKKAESQMRVIRSIKQWTEAFREVDRSIEELQIVFEFSESGDVTEQELD